MGANMYISLIMKILCVRYLRLFSESFRYNVPTGPLGPGCPASFRRTGGGPHPSSSTERRGEADRGNPVAPD
jgi:hypothetical protein